MAGPFIQVRCKHDPHKSANFSRAILRNHKQHLLNVLPPLDCGYCAAIITIDREKQIQSVDSY